MPKNLLNKKLIDVNYEFIWSQHWDNGTSTSTATKYYDDQLTDVSDKFDLDVAGVEIETGTAIVSRQCARYKVEIISYTIYTHTDTYEVPNLLKFIIIVYNIMK